MSLDRYFKNQYFIVFLLTILGFILFFQPILEKHIVYDTFWHLRLADYLKENLSIPRTAIGSFFPEAKYIPHETGFHFILAIFSLLFGSLQVKAFSLFSFGLLFFSIRAAVSKHSYSLFYFYLIYWVLCFEVNWFAPQSITISVLILLISSILKIRDTEKFSIDSYFPIFLSSFVISNCHGGSWPAVLFFGLCLIFENMMLKKLGKKDLILFLAIFIGGLLNLSDINSIFYLFVLKKSKVQDYLGIWQSPNPFDDTIFFCYLLIFLLILRKKLFKDWFWTSLCLGVLVASIISYKSQLMFYATVPFLLLFLKIESDQKKPLIFISIIPFFVFFIYIALSLKVDDKVHMFPVEEVAFLTKNYGANKRVIAPYSSGGYLVHRNQLVLADGRYDPYLQESTKINGKTAFERSVLFTVGKTNQEEILLDRPDFLIIKNDSKIPRDFRLKFGEPIFSGSYGFLYKINKRH